MVEIGSPHFTGPVTEEESRRMFRLSRNGHGYRNDYTGLTEMARMRCLLAECGHLTLNSRKIKDAVIGHFKEYHAHPIEYDIKFATRCAWGCVAIPPHVPRATERHR